MMDKLTFTKIKDIAGYKIYYAIPDAQRKLHINLSRTAMFVMYADQIVFYSNQKYEKSISYGN